MFEFAISQHRKRKPTRRWLLCSVVSCAAHVAALVVLVEHPELLRPGKGHWLSHLLRLEPSAKVRTERDWRTVAVVGGSGRMLGLSGEALRKYAYDWNRGTGTRTEATVRVRLDKGAERGERGRRGFTPALGTKEPKPAPGSPEGVRAAEAPKDAQPGKTAADTAGAPVNVAGAPGSEPASPNQRGTVVYLPPETAPRQAPKKVAETAVGAAPVAIPSGVTAPPEPARPASKAPSQTKGEPKVFADQQQAIRTEGTGFFDTKGFPLGDYAHAVIERIKGNWSIPSNLRNSQGRSTVIFYIEKNGRVLDARIVTSSGSSSLDLAALSSVLGSDPLPPLPPGFPGNHVGAKFVFAYNERQ